MIVKQSAKALLKSIVFTLVLLIYLAGCTDSKPSIETSGDEAMDQTAQYALHTISKLNARGSFEKPSQILSYMTSVQGTAELTPPNPQTEPDAAAYYKGLRPADGVGIRSKEQGPHPFFDEYLLLSANDEQRLIIAEAFEREDDEPYFSWSWEVKAP